MRAGDRQRPCFAESGGAATWCTVPVGVAKLSAQAMRLSRRAQTEVEPRAAFPVRMAPNPTWDEIGAVSVRPLVFSKLFRCA